MNFYEEAAAHHSSQDIRHLARIPIQVHREGLLCAKNCEGTCTQLTPSGFVAEVPAVLYVGEVVHAELRLPGESLRVAARVTYRNHFHYGFYFPALGSEPRDTNRAG